MSVLLPVRAKHTSFSHISALSPHSSEVSSRSSVIPGRNRSFTRMPSSQQSQAGSLPTESRINHTAPVVMPIGCDKSLSESSHPPMEPDAACQVAARPGTSAALLGQMVALRRAGRSLRQIGRHTGRCMEGVRQALMRYENARVCPTPSETDEGEWNDPLRDAEPLPPGHPIAMRGLWRGLERWQTMPAEPTHLPLTPLEDPLAPSHGPAHAARTHPDHTVFLSFVPAKGAV